MLTVDAICISGQCIETKTERHRQGIASGHMV